MTKPLGRRVQRGLDTTNDLLVRSKLVIGCLQPEHMPVMIDLLIADGQLSESDRPHCVHWSALKSASGGHRGRRSCRR